MPETTTDIDLTAKDISALASVDAIAGFLSRLGYPTDTRRTLTAASLGLTGDTLQAVKEVELLAADPAGEFRVLFVRARSLTAKTRNDLARRLGQTGSDYMFVLTSDFSALEFVLVDKQSRQRRGPAVVAPQIIPRTVTVVRRSTTHLDRRILRRLTWTGGDGLGQFDKLRSVFESATFTTDYFQNRALFADHYLQARLHEDPAWRENPAAAYADVKRLMGDARTRWSGHPEQRLANELFAPL